MSENFKDLVIIGGGPAGLSAAIYGKRAMLSVLVIEKDIYGGGQIAVTDRVDNYLGLYGESGYDLAMKFKEHAKQLEVPFLEGEVESLKDGEVKEILMSSGEIIHAKAIFISTGASHRRLGCKGEKELTGMGVSYCATCDGAFFRKKTVAVVGGGDVALQDALYLSNICDKVYIIHRRSELRGAKTLQDRVFNADNIEFLPDCIIEEIAGNGRVESILVNKRQLNQKETIPIAGVFIAVGMEPNTAFLNNLVELDNSGYVVADESCRTGKKGIYAIGDVRTKQLRQLVTAVSDGAVAVASLEADNNEF